MLQEAGKRVALAGMTKRVIFSQEDLTDLSFPDGTFNHVFSWGVIIHIPDVKRALRELARIVAPGGTLALYITNKTAWDHKLEWLVRFIIRKPNKGRRSLQYGSAVEYELHGEKLWVWQFDIPMVQKLLEANGLTITHRVIGEFSEIQRRVKGPIRFGLLHLNNFLFRLRFPARFGVCNLLVFKKLNAPPGEV
jgi:SAM-dependent methyltransferase